MPGLADEVRRHEPAMALTDGGDGLGAYRAIAARWRRIWSRGGRLLVEIGPTQAAAVIAMLAQARARRDLAWCAIWTGATG